MVYGVCFRGKSPSMAAHRRWIYLNWQNMQISFAKQLRNLCSFLKWTHEFNFHMRCDDDDQPRIGQLAYILWNALTSEQSQAEGEGEKEAHRTWIIILSIKFNNKQNYHCDVHNHCCWSYFLLLLLRRRRLKFRKFSFWTTNEHTLCMYKVTSWLAVIEIRCLTLMAWHRQLKKMSREKSSCTF